MNKERVERVIMILKDVVLFLKNNPNPSKVLRGRLLSKISLMEELLQGLSEEEKRIIDIEYRIWYNKNIKGAIDPKIEALTTIMKGW